MDLSQKSIENITIMIDKIVEKLNVLNMGVIKPESFDEDMYDDLKDLYEMVINKKQISPSEMQAIVEELGKLRKKS
ncbi:DUF1128 domain-containing protein [Bacillus carboniphilus]|uniref:UPF0435 protein LC087_17660 n=1 Tax=Bacillus carboniphilus TaxID=86663 RepID=A0ABY9JSX2_9BACI|nr:DUF1128 domain-containing protein [Bacillus carboniphilus]WLR42499.1 DUF1128 domain-containing protein [Bacillus carboniphilus]